MPIYSGSFLVVRSDDPQAVADALGLTDQQNFGTKYPDRSTQRNFRLTWISQPIRGWILVTGAVPHCSLDLSDSDPALAHLRELSKKLSEVQCFGSDNGCPYCHYAWCRDGEVVRAYAFVTDPECVVLWNVGEPPEAEREFSPGHKYIDSRHEGIIPHPEYSDWLPYEETIQVLAGKWSVDPTGLSGHEDASCYSIAGHFPCPWPTPHHSEILSGDGTRSDGSGDVGYAYDEEVGDEETGENLAGEGTQRFTLEVPRNADGTADKQAIMEQLRLALGLSPEATAQAMDQFNRLMNIPTQPKPNDPKE